MTLTRRNFLKGAAVGGLGAATVSLMGGCAPRPAGEGTGFGAGSVVNGAPDAPVLVTSQMDAADETFEGDVVVLGCGPGGIACAARLAEEGAKVLIVEKTENIGGTGMVCSGNCYISLNSQYQLDQGLQADVPAFYKEWLEAVHYHCDHEVLSTYLRNCGRVVDWLLGYGFGFYMKDVPSTNGLSGHAYRISQPPKDDGNRAEVYGKMANSVKSGGGDLYLGCTGKEIIVDESGTVVGLRASKGSKKIDFRGKAVVVASGGFGANQDMINELSKVPLLGRDPVLNEGEGAKMAWAAGAAKPWNLGILCCDTLYPVDSNYHSYAGGIQALGNVMQDPAKTRMHVNQLGKRYHSEDAFCWVPTYGGANGIACDEPWMFVIADEAAIDGLKENDPKTVTDDYLDSMLSAGVLFKGDTIEDLAKAVGWDTDTFSCEFEAYKKMCEVGEDPVFFKGAKYLVPYGDGPYYAVRMAPTPFGTCGDVSVTPRMEVKGIEPGKTVAGLYAVGVESVGTMHNDYYWALGQTVGWAHTSGVLAAEAIVSNVL